MRKTSGPSIFGENDIYHSRWLSKEGDKALRFLTRSQKKYGLNVEIPPRSRLRFFGTVRQKYMQMILISESNIIVTVLDVKL